MSEENGFRQKCQRADVAGGGRYWCRIGRHGWLAVQSARLSEALVAQWVSESATDTTNMMKRYRKLREKIAHGLNPVAQSDAQSHEAMLKRSQESDNRGMGRF